MVKQSLHRPGRPSGLKEVHATRNSGQASGNVLSPTHRLPLPLPWDKPGTHFC